LDISEKQMILHTENFILDGKQPGGVYNGTVAVEMDRIIEDIITKKRKLSIKKDKKP
jgi:hypothetical protein